MSVSDEVRRLMRNRTVRAVALIGALAATANVARAQLPASAPHDAPAPRVVSEFLTSRAPDLLMSEGHALYDTGRYKEAAASFEQAMQLGVAQPHVAARNVARSYERLGNRKQARRWTEIAELLERNPKGLTRPLQSPLLLKI